MKVEKAPNKMKKLLSFLFIASSLFTFAQSSLTDTLTKEQMYQDFDQFMEIVKKYNPQVEIKKEVTKYDVISQIQNFRPTIENIKSSGEFYLFMGEMTACLIDMHAYMLKYSTSQDLVQYLHECNTFKDVDIDFQKEVNKLHLAYLNRQKKKFFSFGNYLLYHDGRYYTMGDIRLFGKGGKVRIREAELLKVGEQTVDEYVFDNLHKQMSAFVCWDYVNKKYYSTMLTLPQTVVTMRNMNNNRMFSVNLSNIQNFNFGTLRKIKGKHSPLRNTVWYFEEENLLYIYIPKMIDGAQQEIIADMQIKLGTKIPDKVVFDVRNNPGGNDDVWMDIVQKLIKDTISMPTIVGIRNQEDIVDFWSKSEEGASYTPIPFQFLGVEFVTFDYGDCTFYPDSQNLGFSGHFYVLQDQGTGSAAHSLSSLCRYSPRFTSIGKATGRISGRGRGPSLFQLQNSKYTFAMECDIDLTNVKVAVDCYQDVPEIIVTLTLNEAILLQFDLAFSSMSKAKAFLLQQDPYFQKVLQN